MKKILSLMVCLTLVICSSILFAACGEEEKPKPSLTIAETIAEKATAIVDELQTKVYNNKTNLGIDHDGEAGEGHEYYTYAKVKDALKDVEGKALSNDYWVECGTFANTNLDDINSITLGGVTYAVTDTFKLSIGNNNFIEDKVVTIDKQTGKISIAAPIVAFELQNEESKLKINDTEYDFLKNEDANVLPLWFDHSEFKNADGIEGNDGVVTNVLVASNSVIVNSADDYLLLVPRVQDPNGKFLVRSSIDGKANFAISGVDDGGLCVFFGRKADNTVDKSLNGKTINYDIYYTCEDNGAIVHMATNRNIQVEVSDFIKMYVNENVREILYEFQEKVYNQTTNTTFNSYQELKDALKTGEEDVLTKGYFVPVGSYNQDITSIEFGGVRYEEDTVVSLSIGNGSFVKDKAFVFEDQQLKIAIPIIAFGVEYEHHLIINGKDVELNYYSYDRKILMNRAERVGKNNTIEKVERDDGIYEYNLTIKNAQEPFKFITNKTPQLEEGLGLTSKDWVLTRKKLEGSDSYQYGFTNLEDKDIYELYPVWNNNGTVPDAKYDGKSLEIDIYLAYTVYMRQHPQIIGKYICTAKLKLNLNIVQGDAQLQQLINEAGTEETSTLVTLPCNFELTKAIEIDKEVTIGLNGKTITENVAYVKGTEEKMAIFWIKDGGKLTVQGQGEVTSDDLYIFMLCGSDKTNTTLSVKNGNYKTDCSIVYVRTGGSAAVEGGRYEISKPENAKYTLNIKDGERANAEIVVTGGTFVGFNPNGAHEGEGSSYLASGYVSTEAEGIWTVTAQA